MGLQELFNDKSIKPKERTEQIAAMLLDGSISGGQLTDFAKTAKDAVKATCIEAIEFASQTKPGIISAADLDFIIRSLADKAPRTRWESAKVIANTIHLFPAKINDAVKNLLDNTEHPGTVVRWSAATALAAILKLNGPVNKTLLPATEAIMEREEKNSIKKIYLAAFKKIK